MPWTKLRVFEIHGERFWVMENLEFRRTAKEKIPRFSTLSFLFWVQFKMENSELKSSETEYSAFSTTELWKCDMPVIHQPRFLFIMGTRQEKKGAMEEPTTNLISSCLSKWLTKWTHSWMKTRKKQGLHRKWNNEQFSITTKMKCQSTLRSFWMWCFLTNQRILSDTWWEALLALITLFHFVIRT